MDPGIRAARDQVAQERLMAAAQQLAKRHGLEDEHAALAAARLGPHARDPLLAALFQREALADFLEALVASTEPPVESKAPAKGAKG